MHMALLKILAQSQRTWRKKNGEMDAKCWEEASYPADLC